MLTLYSHPLASFCQKVLIALYETGTAFDPILVDLGDPGDHARFLDLWPVGKLPVLRDEARDMTVPEASIIIEYLDRTYPGDRPLLPSDPATCLQARLWDRFFDLHVQDPMQKIVFDSFRSEAQKDSIGVTAAEQRLMLAYDMVNDRMTERTWAAGGTFSLADCSAAPALLFAGVIVPWRSDHTALRAYFDRLLERPSFRRVLVEAGPHLPGFPFHDRVPGALRTLMHA